MVEEEKSGQWQTLYTSSNSNRALRHSFSSCDVSPLTRQHSLLNAAALDEERVRKLLAASRFVLSQAELLLPVHFAAPQPADPLLLQHLLNNI